MELSIKGIHISKVICEVKSSDLGNNNKKIKGAILINIGTKAYMARITT